MNNDYIYISTVNNFTGNTTCAEIGLKGGSITGLSFNELDLLWQNEKQLWPRKEKIEKGATNQPAPILFPIAGSLNKLSSYKDNNLKLKKINFSGKNGYLINDRFYEEDTKGYFYDGKFYPMEQHGFARNSMFEVIEYYNDRCLLRLNSNDDIKKQYPFDFQFDVLYKIVNNGINISYTIRNTGNKVMPFNIGDHPGFKLNSHVDNYYLQFDNNNNTYVRYNEKEKTPIVKYLDDNNRLYLNSGMFKNRKAIRMYNVSSKTVSLNNKNENKPTVIYDIESDNLLLWTADTNGLLCIEPWYAESGLFNDFDSNLENGKIKMLLPQEEFSYSRRMRFPDSYYSNKFDAVRKVKSIHK